MYSIRTLYGVSNTHTVTSNHYGSMTLPFDEFGNFPMESLAYQPNCRLQTFQITSNWTGHAPWNPLFYTRTVSDYTKFILKRSHHWRTLCPLKSKELGTNPWKCAIVLEELNLPYENRYVEPEEVKKPPFTDLNPNGRVPCIEDPNTGMVLWESVAINEYLVQTYDPSAALWCPQGPDHFVMKQWLYFQMSGQGPYYGQGLSIFLHSGFH